MTDLLSIIFEVLVENGIGVVHNRNVSMDCYDNTPFLSIDKHLIAIEVRNNIIVVARGSAILPRPYDSMKYNIESPTCFSDLVKHIKSIIDKESAKEKSMLDSILN